jgi:hypothetical protein
MQLRLSASYCVLCVHKPRNTATATFVFLLLHRAASNLERCARTYKCNVESRCAQSAQFISPSVSRQKHATSRSRAAAEHHRHAVHVAVDFDDEGAYNAGI